MATVYGTNATKRDNQTIPALIDIGQVGGEVRLAFDTYVSAGAIPLSTKIRMMTLPEGARVTDVWLDATDLGTVGTLDVGWESNVANGGSDAANGTGFLSAVDVHTAASLTKMSTTQGATGQAIQFTGTTQITINASAATDVAGTIKLYVFYVVA